jgi:hypothetical protein
MNNSSAECRECIWHCKMQNNNVKCRTVCRIQINLCLVKSLKAKIYWYPFQMYSTCFENFWCLIIIQHLECQFKRAVLLFIELLIKQLLNKYLNTGYQHTSLRGINIWNVISMSWFVLFLWHFKSHNSKNK